MPRSSSQPTVAPREGSKRNRTQFVVDDPSLTPEENKRRRAEANKDKPVDSTISIKDLEPMLLEVEKAQRERSKAKAKAKAAESTPASPIASRKPPAADHEEPSPAISTSGLSNLGDSELAEIGDALAQQQQAENDAQGSSSAPQEGPPQGEPEKEDAMPVEATEEQEKEAAAKLAAVLLANKAAATEAAEELVNAAKAAAAEAVQPLAEQRADMKAAQALMQAGHQKETAAQGQSKQRKKVQAVAAAPTAADSESEESEESEESVESEEGEYEPGESDQEDSEEEAEDSEDSESEEVARRKQKKKAKLTKSKKQAQTVQQQKAKAIQDALDKRGVGKAHKTTASGKPKNKLMTPLDEELEEAGSRAHGTKVTEWDISQDPACIAVNVTTKEGLQSRLNEIHVGKDGKMYGEGDKRNGTAATENCTTGQYVEGYEVIINSGLAKDLRGVAAHRAKYAHLNQIQYTKQVLIPHIHPRFLELLEARGEELLSTCRTCKRISSYVSGIGKGRGAPSKLTRFLELSS